MMKTVQAVIDEHGHVRLLERVPLSEAHRALVTILDNDLEGALDETALLSEASLATDWEREEEDEAWRHLRAEM